MKKITILSLMFFLLGFALHSTQAQSTQICICHNAQNNPITVCADDESVLQEAGHGMHLESGFDSQGACPSPTPTTTPTMTPTSTPTTTPTVTPTPTESLPSPTPTPTQASEPSPTPTTTPTATPTPTGQVLPLFCPIGQPYQNGYVGTSNSSVSVSIYNSNFLCAVQNTNQYANTGGNRVSRNVGGGGVTTGNATNGATQDISGNQNQTSVSIFNFATTFTRFFNTGNNNSVNSSSN